MTILLSAPVSTRVLQVLQDFLPAELDLIDTAMADGITTPDIASWHEHEAAVVKVFPAVRIRRTQSDPIETFTTQMGNKVDFRHQMDVLVDVTLANANQDRLALERLVMRYAAGIFTVLAIKHDGLDTTGDSTRWAETTEQAGSVSYGPEAEQEDGTRTRTASIPLSVRRIEVG